MKLAVFPGMGSPDSDLYGRVYRLLSDRASDFGYKEVDLIRWPGHNLKGTLTLKAASEVAADKIKVFTTKYDILARSFGCYVALKVALDMSPRLLRKIILWGPPPYWLAWEMFVRDISTNCSRAKANGTFVDDSLFPSLEPIESMLASVSYDTTVATGAQDPYAPESFLKYLEAIVGRRPSSKFCQSIRFKEAVPGALHEVTGDAPAPVIETYLRTLFM